jgi:hypothetical protein
MNSATGDERLNHTKEIQVHGKMDIENEIDASSEMEEIVWYTENETNSR